MANRVLSYRSEIIGVSFTSLFVFCALSLFSYDVHDPSFFFFSSDHLYINNWCGWLGAQLAAAAFYFFGSIAYVVLAVMLTVSIMLLWGISLRTRVFRILASSASVPLLCAILCITGIDVARDNPGGLVGYAGKQLLVPSLGSLGSLIVLLVLLWLCSVIVLQTSLIDICYTSTKHGVMFVQTFLAYARICYYRFIVSVQGPLRLVAARIYAFKKFFSKVRHHDVVAKRPSYTDLFTQVTPATRRDELLSDALEIPTWWPVAPSSVAQAPHVLGTARSFGKSTREVFHLPNTMFGRNPFDASPDELKTLFTTPTAVEQHQAAPQRMSGAVVDVTFPLPDIALFAPVVTEPHAREDFERACQERAVRLEEKLRHFGVKGKVTAICPGPVITLFEYIPDIDTKISKIIALEDDLALALQAMSIRIVAPIPGRNVVGFEIANEERVPVRLSTLLHDPAFAHDTSMLPLIFGSDILGKPIIEDLVAMPHLLMAGSTGSGKSVGLNAMLAGLLFRARPSDLKLVLVDPKRLEFAPYQDIPHLLFPIVTDPHKVAPILKWLVREMEQRYQKMSDAQVRNLADYRRRFGDLPYIVLVVDELADLMLVAGKEIELSIMRLAQMARAAGIHMILATQRPSVDVITGVIKVNLPSRVAYRVSSKVDSKTILDATGAEKLLGRGDMLYQNVRLSELRRVHGAYVSDEEIHMLTDYLRSIEKPVYKDLNEILAESFDDDGNDQEKDALFDEVYDFVKTQQEISISLLQRKYRIGFNRSARLIAQLEQEGVLAPAQGSKPRKVLLK